MGRRDESLILGGGGDGFSEGGRMWGGITVLGWEWGENAVQARLHSNSALRG